MELPDDVLAIVRDYSRPVFKHYQLYNNAVKVLGVYDRSALKEKLEAETEGLIPTLLTYQNAVLERKEAQRELADFMLGRNQEISEFLEKMKRLVSLEEAVRKANKIEKARYRFLHSILYSYRMEN
jgi:hypothetical protein